MTQPITDHSQAAVQNDWRAVVEEKVGHLRFGVVQIVVHDSKVVQIEQTEKTRLNFA